MLLVAHALEAQTPIALHALQVTTERVMAPVKFAVQTNLPCPQLTVNAKNVLVTAPHVTMDTKTTV